MSAELDGLLADLARSEVRLSADGGRLVVRSAPGALTSGLRERLARHKPELLRRLERSGGGGSGYETIARAPREGPLPLSFAQQRLWFLDQLGAGAAYNIAWALRLRGRLDVPALERTLDEIVRRHEALRTRFPSRDGKAVQVVEPELHVPLAFVDASGTGGGEAEARRLAAEEARRPFDLASGPLVRAGLVRLAPDDHVLLLNIHHVVFDGWSAGVFNNELAALYGAFASGAPSPLPELPVQYADFSEWQRAWLEGGTLARQLGYWKERLGRDRPRLDLPTDRPRPEVRSFRGAAHAFAFPEGLAAALRRLGQGEGATLFMVLLAGFKALLRRYAGEDDVLVGVPLANRTRHELEGLIGFFVNSLVMRTDLSGDPSFRALVGRVREVARSAYENEDLPFERLVEELNPERDASQNPLFQVVLALQNAPWGSLDLPGLTLSAFEMEYRVARFDLEVHLFEHEEHLVAAVVYDTDLFDAATIERMGRHYVTLLQAAAARPDAALSELPLLDPEERRVTLALGRGRRSGYPESTVHDVFAGRAARHPDAPALVCGDTVLSYADLDRRANRLAGHLRDLGVEPGSRVGLCLDRSAGMIVGLLAVLKAGGAYVPLDASHPPDRLAFMLRDAQVSVLLTEERLLPGLPPHAARVVCLDRDQPAWEERPDTPPASGALADDLAYVTYTSGSTGRPKGVEVRHRGVLRLVLAADYARLDEGETLLQLAPVSFDASTLEIWGALLAGGRLVLHPDRLPSPDELGDALRRHGVTSLWLTASLFNAVVDEQPEALGPVRQLLIGGEALSVPHVRRAQERLPGTQIVNGYGPTEGTTFTCCHPIPSPFPADRRSVPVGRPIAHTDVFVLDGRQEPVPVGVPGELYVGGDGLARGYLSRPALTAERFVPHPFADAPGDRLYRTGDRVRWLADGTIEFLGRTDNQVKVRGFRIEPGEIESVLRRHPSVKEAVVLARDGARAGEKRLVAWVVAARPAHEEDAERGRVEKWREVYDSVVYDQLEPGSAAGETFNLAGWISTYTGQPIPPAEMSEQVDQTVARVLEGRPRRVLEIGCGTGLLLFRLAPRCERYVGTDFSAVALDYVRKGAGQRPEVARPLELLERAADDFAGIEPGGFDAVVLNSVVQYFPDVLYLLRVLEGAVRALAPGGRLHVGDVRHLGLLETFAASVQAWQAPGLAPAALRERVREQLAAEQELVVDPAFFAALRRHLPRVSHVEVRPKRGRAGNELTRYRYDAILTVDAPADGPPPERVLDWEDEGLDLDGLRLCLADERPASLLVRRIPNARLAGDLETRQRLERDRADRGEARGEAGRAVEPEDVWALAGTAPYAVELGWAASSSDGRFDALLVRRPPSGAVPSPLLPVPDGPVRPWNAYANAPLRGTQVRSLVPALRRFLQDRLPDYMVPSDVVVLDALPVNPSGKVDVQVLLARELAAPERGEGTPPRTEGERALARVWEEVLGVSDVGVEDNFFELGGDSILGVQIAARAARHGLRLTPRHLFQHQTIAELARAAGDAGEAPLVPLRPRATGVRPVPSFAQQRLWLLDQLQAGPAYDVPWAFRLEGPLDPGALEAALDEVVRRHEILRASFPAEDGQPTLDIAPPSPFGLARLDLRGLGEAERERELARLLREEALWPFDLARGPLLRARLLVLGEAEHVLLLNVHHIVFDGWSMGVFHRELGALYAAFAEGRPSPLAGLPVQYGDVALWQRSWLQGEARERQVRYWRRRLEGLRPVELAMDHPRPPVQTHRGAHESLVLPADLGAALRALGRREGASLFMVLLGGLAVLLQRYSGQDDVAVGTPVANRRPAEVEGLIGLFLNTLVLRTDLSGDPGFAGLVARVSQSALDAFAHQDVPFEALLDELQPERDLGRTPLFQVLFNFVNVDLEPLRLPGITATPLVPDVETAKLDLTVYAVEQADEVALTFSYNADLFEPDTIRRMLHDLRTLLAAGAREPARPLSTLRLEPAEGTGPERAAVRPGGGFVAFHRTDAETTIAERFAAQVRAHGSRVAVKTRAREWTYAELDRATALAAGRLARVLPAARPTGSWPARVGLLLSHDASMVAGLLGALKAGAAYVPLDPSYPADRLAFMLADAEASAILTEAAHEARARELAAGRLPVVRIDEVAPPDVAPAPALGPSFPEDPAYILYTSGSTGQPKGVLQSQRNVLRHISTYTNALRIGPEDRVLLVASFSFDAAVMDVFGALLNGATLLPVDLRADGVEGLAALVAQERVTIYHSTPTVFRPFALGAAPGALPDLRLVVLGGEEVERRDVELFRRHFAPGCVLVNGLGPTESTLALQHFIDHETPLPRRCVPVGRPVADTGVVLLDRSGRETDVLGEIAIRSEHVALGYWKRPDLTAAAFTPDPAGSLARVYRTGDLGRRLPDGTLEFLGRADEQVKLRGIRIEPREVESVLLEHPGVAQAVALVREDRPDDRVLVAYFVAAPGAAPSARELRAHLRAKLPEPMVPGAFVALPAFPLTPSRKLDRRALPAPGPEAREAAAPNAPETPAQKAVAEIFCEVLGLARVGSEDGFFDLGGHSLKATQVVSRIRRRLGVDLKLRRFFETPTVAGLARAVEDARRSGPRTAGSASIPRLDRSRRRLPAAGEAGAAGHRPVEPQP